MQLYCSVLSIVSIQKFAYITLLAKCFTIIANLFYKIYFTGKMKMIYTAVLLLDDFEWLQI